MPSTNWTPQTLKSTNYSPQAINSTNFGTTPASLKGAIMDDSNFIIDDSVLTMDDAAFDSVNINSTNWTPQ